MSGTFNTSQSNRSDCFDYAKMASLLGCDMDGISLITRHWEVNQIKEELLDSYHILLSKDAVNSYLKKYQVMVEASHQDLERF